MSPAANKAAATMGPRQILVIDDDCATGRVTRLALQLVGGWDVFTATTGDAGVAAASRHQPDAILLDLVMPVMDGAATLAVLKADPGTSNIPVILFTAEPSAISRRCGVGRQDLAGVIAKPFDPMTLAAEIAVLLHWPATR